MEFKLLISPVIDPKILSLITVSKLNYVKWSPTYFQGHTCTHPRRSMARKLGRRDFGRKFTTRTEELLDSYTYRTDSEAFASSVFDWSEKSFSSQSEVGKSSYTKMPSFRSVVPGSLRRPHESFKAIHILGPAYLSDLINIRRCSSYNLRCNVGVFLHDPSAKFKRTLGDRSFTAAFQRFGPSYRTILGNKVMKTKRFQDRVKCTMANRGVWEEISINAPSFPVVEG